MRSTQSGKSTLSLLNVVELRLASQFSSLGDKCVHNTFERSCSRHNLQGVTVSLPGKDGLVLLKQAKQGQEPLA